MKLITMCSFSASFPGGGSAILCAPVPGVSLEDKVEVSKQSLRSGGKHRATQRREEALIAIQRRPVGSALFSFGNLIEQAVAEFDHLRCDRRSTRCHCFRPPPQLIPPRFNDALKVLHDLSLMEKAPSSVVTYLQAGARGEHAETLKQAIAIDLNSYIVW